MKNKVVVIIKSLKVPKIKRILLYGMKFLVPNYSCIQNPWLGGYRPQILVLSSTEFVEPPEQNSWVRHCLDWLCEPIVIFKGYWRREAHLSQRLRTSTVVSPVQHTPWSHAQVRRLVLLWNTRASTRYRRGLQGINLQAPCVLYIGQAFRYSPENAFYIFNQHIFHYLIFAWPCIIDINNIDNQLDATVTAY